MTMLDSVAVGVQVAENPANSGALNVSEPQYYNNRELSWLEFNQRVLDEGTDPSVPLLERLKFLCIVASNLDEFFMVRVAGVKQQQAGLVGDRPPDAMTPAAVMQGISQRSHEMARQAAGNGDHHIEAPVEIHGRGMGGDPMLGGLDDAPCGSRTHRLDRLRLVRVRSVDATGGEPGHDPGIEPVREIRVLGRTGRQDLVMDDAPRDRWLVEQSGEDGVRGGGGVGSHRRPLYERMFEFGGV